MSKRSVAILAGGISAEHEVSVITGLQVAEKIDREKYEPHFVYLTQNGAFKYFPGLLSRKQFKSGGGVRVDWGHDEKGTFIRPEKLLTSKIYLDAAYLTFHGGNGESGQIQGFLEILQLPYTSPNVEASAITMNKVLTREVLQSNGILMVQGVRIMSEEYRGDSLKHCGRVKEELGLPVIIKPVHLGSSIGIHVAKTEVELEKYLMEASMIDSEIDVEKYMTDFKEYNCAVRQVAGKLEASEIERPLSKDEILSFADKYQRGGNKKAAAGMASSVRELPAKIDSSLRDQIQDIAKRVFVACRCKGMVRIDFMVTGKGEIYVIEVNPIPGSMAFYLWEASGISFKQQISDLIEQAIEDTKEAFGKRIVYKTDIVEKFVNA